MWKHALQDFSGKVNLPETQAHEAHIIKTAQRIEELNSWVSQSLEPWDCLIPKLWYLPNNDHKPFAEGYACCFKHNSLSLNTVYEKLEAHIQSHEQLKSDGNYIYFRRC